MRKPRPLHVALAAIGLIAASFGALEAAFRNHAPRADDQLYDPGHVRFLIDAAGPIFVRSRGWGGDSLVPKASRSPYVQADQRFPFDKRPGTKRIVVVGESSALGLGAALAIHVRQAAPDSGIEVLNMGFGGASLEQVENNFRESLRYDPDVVILCFGHNLMMSHPALTPLELRMNSAIRKSHFLSFLIDRRDRPPFVQASLGSRMEALNRFIRDSARLAKERHIALVVCTMPSNLMFPPVSDAGERAAAPYLESSYEAAKPDDGKALAILRDAADKDPVPLWIFQTARRLLRKGDYAAARGRFLAAKDLDRQHDRAAAPVNALIRAAGRDEKLVVLDFDRLVAALAPHGIPGWESFIDHVHVSTPLRTLEASVAWKACRGPLGAGPAAGPADSPIPPPGLEPAEWKEFALDVARRGLPYQDQRSAALRSLLSDELRLNEKEFVPLL
ncbi:MAG: SGNH/GDSL hydrolase family protein, partial [Elusimicrobiota bacterium]